MAPERKCFWIKANVRATFFPQAASVTAILNLILNNIFLVHLWSSTSCKPSGKATIHNFQEFLIIKRNAKLARYSCHCFLRHKQISVAWFDTRLDTVIIGYSEGFLLNGDFRKSGHFPSSTIVSGLAGSKLQMAKWQVGCLASACSVTKDAILCNHSLRGLSTHQDIVA